MFCIKIVELEIFCWIFFFVDSFDNKSRSREYRTAVVNDKMLRVFFFYFFSFILKVMFRLRLKTKKSNKRTLTGKAASHVIVSIFFYFRSTMWSIVGTFSKTGNFCTLQKVNCKLLGYRIECISIQRYTSPPNAIEIFSYLIQMSHISNTHK